MIENVTEKKPTSQQMRAIAALLTEGNATKVCEMIGISRPTLYRWLHDDTFVAALRQAEQDAIATLSRALCGLSELATQALRDGLHNAQPINTRLRAASTVIDSLLKIRELNDIESRLIEMERMVNGQGQNQTPALAGSSLAAPTGNGATVDTITG